MLASLLTQQRHLGLRHLFLSLLRRQQRHHRIHPLRYRHWTVRVSDQHPSPPSLSKQPHQGLSLQQPLHRIQPKRNRAATAHHGSTRTHRLQSDLPLMPNRHRQALVLASTTIGRPRTPDQRARGLALGRCPKTASTNSGASLDLVRSYSCSLKAHKLWR